MVNLFRHDDISGILAVVAVEHDLMKLAIASLIQMQAEQKNTLNYT